MPGDIVWKSGDRITITDLRGVATVIEGPNKRGEYLVTLNNLTIWVSATRFTAAPAKPAKSSRKKAKRSAQPPTSGDDVRIDLHGLTVDQAKQKMEECLDRALLLHADRIEIIHGIGTGALRAAIHAYLSESKHISKFAIDPKNPGTTWAYL